MPDVLIIGDTFRSPELRNEIPLGVPDPFVYLESDGARHVYIGSMEVPRIRDLGLDLYEPAVGGVRLEDIVLVTDDGCEVLTEFPYDMEV